jgi:hypothetical protein
VDRVAPEHEQVEVQRARPPALCRRAARTHAPAPLSATSSASAPVTGSGPLGTSSATAALRKLGLVCHADRHGGVEPRDADEPHARQRREGGDRARQGVCGVADVRPEPDVRPNPSQRADSRGTVRACRPSPFAFCTPRPGRTPSRWNERSSRRAPSPRRAPPAAGSSPRARPTCASSPAHRTGSRSASDCGGIAAEALGAGAGGLVVLGSGAMPLATRCATGARSWPRRPRPDRGGARQQRLLGGYRGACSGVADVLRRPSASCRTCPADNALPRWLAEVARVPRHGVSSAGAWDSTSTRRSTCS